MSLSQRWRALCAQVVAVVFVGLPVSALAQLRVDPTAEFTVSQIPGMHQYNARVWGQMVIWTVDAMGDVWGENMDTGEVFFIGQGGRSAANLHETRVVWAAPTGVSVFNVDTRQTTLVTGYTGDSDPDIHGPLVVWAGMGGICIKNIDAGSESAIPGATGGDPLISGDSVIWVGGGMWGYKLSSQTSFFVSASGTPQSDLQGNIVVWRDDYRNYDDSYLDIYAADISDPHSVVEFPVCTHTGEQTSPAVYGSVIVWTDYRNGDMDVYGYDIASGTEFPIATGPGNQFSPAIYETFVVWSYEPILHGEVYLRGNYIIPEPATLAVLALGALGVLRRKPRR